MQVTMLTKASATRFTLGCKGPSFFPQLRQLLSVVEDSPHKSFVCRRNRPPSVRLSAESRVERWRGGLGVAYLLSRSFVCGCLTSCTMLRFHTPAHRTVRADFSHTALRLASLASTRWLCLAFGRDSENIAIFAGK